MQRVKRMRSAFETALLRNLFEACLVVRVHQLAQAFRERPGLPARLSRAARYRYRSLRDHCADRNVLAEITLCRKSSEAFAEFFLESGPLIAKRLRRGVRQ